MGLAGQKIAIVGAGQVGAGWAIVFARAGAMVKVFDGSAATIAGLDGFFETSLAAMARHRLLVEAPAAIIARMRIVETLEAAVADADYIQESVFERLDVKIDIAARIAAAMHPTAICGSSTSGFPGSAFTADLPTAPRFMVVHPVNPPHLIPVVEIVPTPATDPAVVLAVREMMAAAGQAPVVLAREIDGFILNRLQGALLDEAWKLFEAGYASGADIDATVAQGLGLRWSFMGPFETIDLNAPDGIDDYCARLAPMYRRLARLRDPGAQIWPDEVVARAAAERREIVAAQDLAARRAWRDERLMALLAHKASPQTPRDG
jgi:3-hydroxyacyl-CoA dehydrogenase